MSGKPRNALSRFLHRAPAALGAVATLHAPACQDPSRGVAPPSAPPPVFDHAPAPGTGVLVGAPLFGLDAAPDGSLLAAVASSGIVDIRAGTTTLVAGLPGVNGVAAIGRGDAFAVTGGSLDPSMIFPTSRKLFRVSNGGGVQFVADLWAYEQAENPDQFWNQSAVPIESNPFDVAALNGGHVLVADAAANDVLHVDARGAVDWVAVLTPVDLPAPQIDPQPVPTSIAIGPDGAYYVGELTGFPGVPGLSRVWRIAAGSRHVVCPSVACTPVASGFTSIMDIAFAPNGTLYVVEFDEASWLGVEGGGFQKVLGGTVNACSVATGACSVVASGLSLPTAITVDKAGGVWVAEHEPMLFAGARVRRLDVP